MDAKIIPKVIKTLITRPHELGRRYYYALFRRDYINASIKKRKGNCRMCGCCRNAHAIGCKYIDMNSNICLLWKEKGFEALPYICRIYPFDEKDKCKYSRENCGFYWNNKKEKSIETRR